jgi:hypothetical protein
MQTFYEPVNGNSKQARYLHYLDGNIQIYIW